MVRRLRWIGLSISVLFVVLFGLVVSPKAKAVSLNINAVPTGVSWDFENAGGRCQMFEDVVINGTSGPLKTKDTIGSGWCFAEKQFQAFTAISTSSAKPVKEGNYYVFTFYTMGYTHSYNAVTWNVANYTENFALISYDLRWQGNGLDYCEQYRERQWSDSDGNSWITNCSGNLKDSNLKVRQWQVILQAKHTGNYTIGIGRYGEKNELLRIYSKGNDYFGAVRLASIEEYSPNDSTSQILNNEKDNNEQQGTQSNTDSDQAGQDVEGATTNLLSAITGFFGAFTSASATTCQTDWGIEGFRNFDFCGTQVPTQLQVIFTIVASIIFIPMIWFLITSILNAFKEFQQ